MCFPFFISFVDAPACANCMLLSEWDNPGSNRTVQYEKRIICSVLICVHNMSNIILIVRSDYHTAPTAFIPEPDCSGFYKV